MQRHFRLGGGVAPETIRLRGKGLIEYVLIAAVIGLVVVFAGPRVSGAIRNQFNQVSTTLDSGTDGGIGGRRFWRLNGSRLRDRPGGGGKGREGLDSR